jgi:hypothetical protein
MDLGHNSLDHFRFPGACCVRIPDTDLARGQLVEAGGQVEDLVGRKDLNRFSEFAR